MGAPSVEGTVHATICGVQSQGAGRALGGIGAVGDGGDVGGSNVRGGGGVALNGSGAAV